MSWISSPTEDLFEGQNPEGVSDIYYLKIVLSMKFGPIWHCDNVLLQVNVNLLSEVRGIREMDESLYITSWKGLLQSVSFSYSSVKNY